MAAPKGKRPITRATKMASEIMDALDALWIKARDLTKLLDSRDASSDTGDSKRKQWKKRAKKTAKRR